MKFLQKTWVAVAVTAAMIVAAVFIGSGRGSSNVPTPKDMGLDTTLSTGSYENYIWDEAGQLSKQQIEEICLYNANWVERYDSLIAVAVMERVNGSIDKYAYALGTEIELASADGILVIDVEEQDAYLAVGPDYPLSDNQISNYMNNYLYDFVVDQEYGDGVLNLFAALNTHYVENYGLGSAERYGSSGSERVIAMVTLLVILLVIATVIDNLRYTAYHQQYYGIPNPPYVFRPILFWHGPGYRWYRRRWNRRPPPPRSGPHGGGFGGSGGFGGFSGGFGSGPRGGGFGGRGGGFGGGFGGGGFGGGRGGGFGGGARGGGFGGGGGGRGGGFGR